SVACAGLMERRDGLVIQPVASPTPRGIGAIVAADAPGSRLIHLDYLEYWSYRSLIDRYGVEMMGAPMGRQDRDGVTMVMLTRGAIVGLAPAVSYVIMGPSWREWMERGGIEGDMGIPISTMRDHQGKRIQDFENGRLEIDLTDPTRIEWVPIVN